MKYLSASIHNLHNPELLRHYWEGLRGSSTYSTFSLAWHKVCFVSTACMPLYNKRESLLCTNDGEYFTSKNLLERFYSGSRKWSVQPFFMPDFFLYILKAKSEPENRGGLWKHATFSSPMSCNSHLVFSLLKYSKRISNAADKNKTQGQS